MTSLRFEVLGEVRALRDGVAIDLGPAKQRAVLAVLLLHAGRPVPTHQIVDAVWGDDPPENGANVVQKYVAGLRRVLDPDRAPRTPGELLALTGSGYELRTGEAVLDVDEFQGAVDRAAAQRAAGRLAEASAALRAGLALWRGDALAGLGGPVFDAARTRLTEGRAGAWESWAELELALGRAAPLIPELTRLVAEFPLREGLRTQLMLALHRTGRQAEALAVFRDAREYFLDEFGAEPGERMQEAHRGILRGAPVSPAPVPFPAPAFPPPPIVYVPPARRHYAVLEVLLAVFAPLFTCFVGGWAYFAYTGIRRREVRYFVFAGLYFVLFVLANVIFFILDPTPIDSDTTSTAEDVGLTMLFGLPLVAIIHGVAVAVSSSDAYHKLALRDQARQFAHFAPDRAREAGIGRPDLSMRVVDDGGLIDLNHLGGPELAAATGMPLDRALAVVADRAERGPFRQPHDLVYRGLADERTVRRLAPRLICIPPAHS